MKSKLTEPKLSSVKKEKKGQSYDFLNYNDNNAFDFVGLYKTAAETNKILENTKSNETLAKDKSNNNIVTPKRERSLCKKLKKRKPERVDISQINIDSSSFNSTAGASVQINSKTNLTTTGQSGNVKSIMKNASVTDQSVDSVRSDKSSGKSKKRNKSVSFMLDDNEEVVIKRTKSDDSIKTNKSIENNNGQIKDKKKHKKIKKYLQSEKENAVTNINEQYMEVNSTPVDQQAGKAKLIEATPTASGGEVKNEKKRKKFKKFKKQKAEVNTQETESCKNMATSESKIKKLKKKKFKKSVSLDTEEENGEPNAKFRKTDDKPDIVEDLENLSIGDNAHTLTNLLDEMTVVDKDKKKKFKQQVNKKLKSKENNKQKTENFEGKEQEKVKWNKRKWNKDKKGTFDDETLANVVVVENLPLNIMLNYKKILTDHFVKYGLIKTIGIAEVYPTEESKPVFTTTIHFYSDGAATQALELNNTEMEGSFIRVKHPLPRTATTIVVRSYGELTDQNISSTFLGAGKIRSVRHLVKGKKAMATSFVEFDGPEAVKRALKKMGDAKIGGKKIHMAKFESRPKKKKVKEQKHNVDSAADADSEDSND